MASPHALNFPERGTATPIVPATVAVVTAARAASAIPTPPPFGTSRDRASISWGESFVATMSSARAVSRSRSAGGRKAAASLRQRALSGQFFAASAASAMRSARFPRWATGVSSQIAWSVCIPVAPCPASTSARP